jgi:hypothetical protein|tara:strand:+ start:1473 stop:2618 length:1146 start_codon:yes stop_codon:yes gene_type:complete
MNSFEKLIINEPHSKNENDKNLLFKKALVDNFEHHYNNCEPYRNLCDSRGWHLPLNTDFKLEDFPYLPIEIFKNMSLRSTKNSKIIKTLKSSATSQQTPSTIFLDKETSKRQMQTLIWFLSNRLGKNRRPFIVMDLDPNDISDKQNTITARTAAVRGFLTASSSYNYCMKQEKSGEMHIDLEKFEKLLKETQNSDDKIVIFGYTFVFYIYVAQELKKRGVRFKLQNATILHIGGWKKLQSQSTDKETFNQTMIDVFGVERHNIIDCYGFTEQLGVVYLDGKDGLKRTSEVSEIIVRDQKTLLPCEDGKEGLLEFISPLPLSYPGNAILTDDIGKIISREKGNDGRTGVAFEILGRRPKAEIRGCGDILSESIFNKKNDEIL